MTNLARSPELLLPKDVGETDVLTFDYTDSLAEDELILSATVTITVVQGVDASPSAVLSGGAQIATPYALQRVIGGVRNVTYLVSCAAVTDDSRTLVVAGLLPVIAMGQP